MSASGLWVYLIDNLGSRHMRLYRTTTALNRSLLLHSTTNSLMQNKQLQQGTVLALQFACSLCIYVCNIYIDPSSTNWQLTHNKLAIRVRVQLGRAANFRSVTQAAECRVPSCVSAIYNLQLPFPSCRLPVAGCWLLVCRYPARPTWRRMSPCN